MGWPGDDPVVDDPVVDEPDGDDEGLRLLIAAGRRRYHQMLEELAEMETLSAAPRGVDLRRNPGSS